MHIDKPKGGKTEVVSGAVGAVVNLVEWIAKLQGFMVVGIAESDEKTNLLPSEFRIDKTIFHIKNLFDSIHYSQ